MLQVDEMAICMYVHLCTCRWRLAAVVKSLVSCTVPTPRPTRAVRASFTALINQANYDIIKDLFDTMYFLRALSLSFDVGYQVD